MNRPQPRPPVPATFFVGLGTCLVLGAFGLIGLNWEWTGPAAGMLGIGWSAAWCSQMRRPWFFAPLGMSAAFTAMECWLLWERSGDAEVIDPLVFMGAAAGLVGLVIGGLTAGLVSMISREAVS